MPALLKDVLWSGLCYPPALRGEGIEFTPADVLELAKRGNEMIAAGWDPPVCYEHLHDAVPMSRTMTAAERRARGFIGGVQRFVPRGSVLDAWLNVDGEDAKQVQRIARVSPFIDFDVRTGDGKVWDGPSIAHIAVTPTPVVTNQQPFRQPAAVALSLSSLRSRAIPLCFARSDYEGAAMDEDLDLDDVGTGSGATDTDAGTEDTPLGEPAGDAGDSELMGVLEQLGLFIPPDAMKNIKTFKQALLISGKTKLNTDPPEMDDAAEELPPEGMTGEPPPDAMAAQAMPPNMPGAGMGMSRQKPNGNGLTLAAACEKLIEQGRTKLTSDIDALLKQGKITPVRRQQLLEELRRTSLALSRTGDLAETRVSILVEGYKANPRGLAHPVGTSAGKAGAGKKPAALSRAGAKAVERPVEMTGPPETEAEARAVNDQMDLALTSAPRH